MSFLKKVSDDSTVWLKDILHSRVGGDEPARQFSTVHASMLTNDKHEFCQRQAALMDLHNVQLPPQHIDTAMRVTFDQGWDVQSRLNNDYLRDIMWGVWVCTGCGEEQLCLGRDIVRCTSCEGPSFNFRYQELYFFDAEYHFSSSIDGFVLLGGQLHMVEFKIIDKDQWIDLLMPLSEHTARTQLYLDMLARHSAVADWPYPFYSDEARIVYTMRGFGKKDDQGRISPFKEYIIKADSEAVKGYLQMAEEVKLYREDGVVPAYKLCAHSMCPRAKACPVSKECFGGD